MPAARDSSTLAKEQKAELLDELCRQATQCVTASSNMDASNDRAGDAVHLRAAMRTGRR